MSHVWGQTLPSNYGRLNPSAQREYKVDVLGDVGKQAAKKTAKEVAEEMQAKIGKELITELSEQVTKEVGEDVSAEIMEKAMKETLEEVGEDASAELLETTLKKNLKNMTEEALQTTTKKTTKKATKKAIKEIPEGAIERVGKRVINVGAASVTAVLIFNDFMGSDAVDAWVKSSTGQDCDEKAEAASLESGTPEFTEHVTKCQEAAAESLGMIGKVITYGGIAVGGLVALSILSKIGLFSSSKE
jgi:hypothetical protein